MWLCGSERGRTIRPRFSVFSSRVRPSLDLAKVERLLFGMWLVDNTTAVAVGGAILVQDFFNDAMQRRCFARPHIFPRNETTKIFECVLQYYEPNRKRACFIWITSNLPVLTIDRPRETSAVSVSGIYVYKETSRGITTIPKMLRG